MHSSSINAVHSLVFTSAPANLTMATRGSSQSLPTPRGRFSSPLITSAARKHTEGEDAVLQESAQLFRVGTAWESREVVSPPDKLGACAGAGAGDSSARRRPGDRHDNDGDGGDWFTLTLLAAAAIFICYADRSNISTAIIPMAKEFGWDKVYEGGVLSVGRKLYYELEALARATTRTVHWLARALQYSTSHACYYKS